MAAIWMSWPFFCKFVFLEFELFLDTFAILNFPCISRKCLSSIFDRLNQWKLLACVCYWDSAVLLVSVLVGYQPIILSGLWRPVTKVFKGVTGSSQTLDLDYIRSFGLCFWHLHLSDEFQYFRCFWRVAKYINLFYFNVLFLFRE